MLWRKTQPVPAIEAPAAAMILTCPACAMRYLVPDTAIPPSGRQVRCANCRHSWHQEPAEAEASAPSPFPAVRPQPPVPPSIAPREAARETRPVSNRPAPAPPERVSVMDHRPPFARRRNPLRTWTWIAGGLAALILALGVAAWWVGRAPIAAALGLPTTAESPLLITGVTDHQRIGEARNILMISGNIRNVSDEEQAIPAILAEGVDANGRVIYSWTFPPPRARIAPGETVPYNNAQAGATDKITDVFLSFDTARP